MLEFDRRHQVSPPTKNIPVSVVMICKNCAEPLKDTLGSINRNFLRDGDEILIVDTGSTDNTIEVAKSFGARVVERPDLRKPIKQYITAWLPERLELFEKETQFSEGCILDFSEARQIAADAAKHDIQFWIDSDDVLEEHQPGTLRDMVNQHMGTMDAIFLQYAYTFDPADKKLTTVLKRERVYDRRKFSWKGKCHETCIPKDGVPLHGCGWFPDYAGAIVHKHGRQDHVFGDLRNYIIIRKEIEDDKAAGRKPDLRSIFYLGNACRGLGKLEDAVACYNTIIEKSGSKDDRFSAAYYVATAFLRAEVARPIDALDYAFRALRINPTDPRGPFTIARAYFLLGRWEDSISWYRMGCQLHEPRQTLHSYDPEHINSLPHQIAAFAYKELGDVDSCRAALEKLQRARPNHPDTVKVTEVLSSWNAGLRLIDSLKVVAANRRPTNKTEADRILRELITPLPEIPKELEESGMGRIEPADPRPLGDDTDLTIFCGPTAEAWGPANRKTGIGGSEKAVLEMSSRLQRRGFRVSVYASVPLAQRGVDDCGVLWRHFSEFDYTQPRGILISWRNPAGALMPVPAQKRIVWCHDVQRPADWSPEIIAAVDEVWVLSHYHAETLGPVRELLGKKLWITRNGIDSDLFARVEEKDIIRKPNRVVYMSSPDRGVLTAIKAFQQAFAKDPSAELHIFYGFTKMYLKMAARYEYSHFPDTAQDENYYDYMQRVLKAVDYDERIKWRGRVGPDQLAAELFQSGVWLYPTRFPEISCMSAMEAQAAGCHVVASDKAALLETIDWTNPDNVKIDPDKPDKTAVALHKSANSWAVSEPFILSARKRFDYGTLADEWAVRLKGGAA